jgi:maltooligosyltrehalose trehalohydrolase
LLPLDSLAVTWRFAGGTLRFLANFGDGTADLDKGDGRVLWVSPAATIGVSRARLPSWTGVFLKTMAR